MSSKSERQRILLELVCDLEIDTQDQLSTALEENGIVTTQATISRDLKELKIRKEISRSGKSIYMAPLAKAKRNGIKVLLQGQSAQLDYVNNIIVLHAKLPVLQIAVKMLKDRNDEGVVGKIMDDDTMFILFRASKEADNFIKELLGKEEAKGC